VSGLGDGHEVSARRELDRLEERRQPLGAAVDVHLRALDDLALVVDVPVCHDPQGVLVTRRELLDERHLGELAVVERRHRALRG
jgi:hypothetical protein